MIDIFSSTVVLAYRSVCCNAEDYKKLKTKRIFISNWNEVMTEDYSTFNFSLICSLISPV